MDNWARDYELRRQRESSSFMGIARVVLNAYERSRGMSHTTLALQAVEQFGGILVVLNQQDRHYIARRVTEGVPVDIVPVSALEQMAIDRPLIFDNHVIMALAEAAWGVERVGRPYYGVREQVVTDGGRVEAARYDEFWRGR